MLLSHPDASYALSCSSNVLFRFVLSSEIREDQILGSGSEELSGGLRLGTQALPQVHGL